MELVWINDNYLVQINKSILGNSMAVQWLGIHAFTAKDAGPIPGWGTKIPQASGPKKTKTKTKKLMA